VASKPAYQVEPAGIRCEILQQGYISPLQLIRIVAWKSAKGLAPLSLNTEGEIRQRTQSAVELSEPLRAFDVLANVEAVDWSAWREIARSIVGTDAVNARRDRTEPSGLLALKGVGYPVATAILCVLDPTVWPVMDKWSARTVFGDRLPKRRVYCALGYEAFARHLVTEGARHWRQASSVHLLDQEAMKVSDPKSPEVLPQDWVPAHLP